MDVENLTAIAAFFILCLKNIIISNLFTQKTQKEFTKTSKFKRIFK